MEVRTPPAVAAIRFGVMHDQALLALGLVSALRQQVDMHPQAEPWLADVLIADPQGGMRLLADRRRQSLPCPRVIVVALSLCEQEIRQSLERGVHGYLLLSCGPEELVAGVRQVHRGGRYLCAPAAQCLADSMSLETLTLRELDVLRLLACGVCNKTVASDLGIALGTVKAHVSAIFDKLGASSRTQAVQIARQRGLIKEGLTVPQEMRPVLRYRTSRDMAAVF